MQSTFAKRQFEFVVFVSCIVLIYFMEVTTDTLGMTQFK